MAPDHASEALSQCAGRAELEELEDIQMDPTSISALQSLLLDVYTLMRPKSSDYENRGLLIQVLKKVVANTFGNSTDYLSVEAYGSFVMDLFTARSDLDLSVNFSNGTSDYPHDKKILALRQLTKALEVHQKNGVFKGLLPLLQARAPVVKVVDHVSGIECDISIESKDGISISQFFKLVSSIDAQTRKPAIFPPFSSLLKDGIDMSSVKRNVTGYRNFGRSNQESVAELFITLLVKLASVNDLWQQGICASAWEGRWVYKLWKIERGEMSVGIMSVENFLDRSENFSRRVGKSKMNIIAKCIADSLVDLSFFMRGQIDASRLKKLLFKSSEQDALGKLPAQKVEPSMYSFVELSDKKPEKNKELKNEVKKVSPEATNLSDGETEEIGQKRKASPTVHGTLKNARNTEPSRENSDYQHL